MIMARLLSTVGLIADIWGAWLVAWEVVRQFQGARFLPVKLRYGNPVEAQMSPEYEEYERTKY
jgi:hypothetical protein